MTIDKIIITGNILRYIDGQTYDTPWLYPAFQYLIGSFSNLPVIKMHNETARQFVRKFYELLKTGSQDFYSWIKIYNEENTKETLDLVNEYFKNSLVIAFELHPILQKAFDELKIPYVKLMNHPIRYMDDIFFGITSSEIDIHKKLKKYETSENYYFEYASILKGIAGVHEFTGKTEVPPDTAVFFAQTNMDCSLLDGNRMVGFLDYKDKFEEICEKYENVYYKIHPLERNEEIINFVKSFKNVKILYPEDINVYDLLSSENVKKCYSISSGALYEAKYFGKETEYFLHQPFMFVNDYKDKNYDYKNTFVPVYKTWWNPSFWADILEGFIAIDKPVPKDLDETFSNKLRLILNLTWGYNDCSSVAAMKKFDSIENKIEKVKKHIAHVLTFYIPIKSLRRSIREKIEREI